MENFSNFDTIPKFRPPFSESYYRNSSCNRNLRQTRNEYVVPVCSRRSTSSNHALYQENFASKSLRQQKLSKGKVCSIVLVVASFIVLIIVLSIAGLALYLGGLHIDNSSLISYNCSAKILRGDRFISGLKEKAQKYQLQLETLYKKSILSPCLVSCTVEKFGIDTFTIFFKINLNKERLPRSILNVEKTIRDILINDAISRKPIFRSVRFDPKSIQVKLNEVNIKHDKISSNSKKLPIKKSGIMITTISPNKDKEINLSVKPESVIHGSFKISKTEADITEKKTDNNTRSIIEKITQIPKTTTTKTTFVASNLLKVKQEMNSTTVETTTQIQEELKNDKKQSEMAASTTETQIFDQKPWIPIIPDLHQFSTTLPPTVEQSHQQPVYTSFTNPGLSFHFGDMETLGSTSLKGHPIPINKIPTSTEPSKLQETHETKQNTFVEINTLKYLPDSSNSNQRNDNGPDILVRNLSSIFHVLGSSFNSTNISKNTMEEPIIVHSKSNEDIVLGTGQAVVVEEDEELYNMQTTKLPLITLIPVKSNSGIRTPLRQRPHQIKNSTSFGENRSFPGSPLFNGFILNPGKSIETEVVTSVSSEINHIKMVKDQLTDFKITGVLNFATESSRNPKIGPSPEIDRSTNKKTLTIQQLAQLSEISKVTDNATKILTKTKASSAFSISQNGFNLLTKTFNKIPLSNKEFQLESFNRVPCDNSSVKCGDGECLPQTVKCNQLIDCNDGVDERNCNCADYLKSQFLARKICDGIVDCWDYSDENQCEWCSPNKYVCANSKVCIDQKRICDGVKDCYLGDDERECVTITNSSQVGSSFYDSKGFLMVRKNGIWGKLCIENFEKNITSLNLISWRIADLGRGVCKTMTYQNLSYIEGGIDTTSDNTQKYYELARFFNATENTFSFLDTTCESKRIIQVECESLECGVRPQIVKQARIVGGGNAGLGSWPWQAALYKEGEFQCGATLLSNLWLVSAGHCFFHSQEDYWVARLGALRRGTNLPSPYEQLRSIIQIIVHPRYIDSGFINDISLLKMESPLVFSDYVRPICLPTPGQSLQDGQLCTVIGWGQLFEVGRIFPDTLQEVQVPIISTAECKKKTVFLPLYKITDDMFCAGFERGGRDACLGDSGGPLMCPTFDGKWTLQGITSNGYGCARANRPGVYTKVANYVDWINSYLLRTNNYKNFSKSRSNCAGHRCPLGECLPKNRLCNGFIECSDGSDERDC